MNKFNTSFKRLLCALIAAMPLSASLNAFASLPAEVAGTRFEEPVRVLSALKIMNGDENGKFRLDDTIIRSEVAKMAVHAMGLDSSAASVKGETPFNDVSSDHWASGYINVASSLKLIEGDGDGSFRPNDNISYEEAMAIMTRATGYEQAAKDKGGYPAGYMSVGTTIGLSKNVQTKPGEKILRGDVAYLTSNALEVKLMEQKIYGNSSSYEITDKTLLKDKLNVEKLEGQITAVESTSIDGKSALGKNQARIDGKVYTTDCNLKPLLGYNVKYYLKSDSKGNSVVILATAISSKNSSVNVSDSTFARLTTKNGNPAVVYYKDEDKKNTSTAEIAADAKMIFNGKQVEFDKKYLDLSEVQGNISLLDSDKNGSYDVITVTHYENMVVETVSSSGRITDKLSDKALKLDENVDYTLTLGSAAITPKDLKEWDVLSVAKSADGELYDIVVTRDTVEGKVTGKDDEGIYIDDKHYKLALNYNGTINIGMNGVFYLDCSGRIAAADSNEKLSSGYAYLINAYVDSNGSDAYFRLFTREGKTESFKTNEKIRLNGKSGVKAIDAVNSFKGENGVMKQLVTFETNSDGRITEITTAQDNTESGKIDTNSFTKNQILENTEYSASTSKLGDVRISDSTVVFDMTDSEKDGAVADKSFFEDSQKYSAIVYDLSENYTAGVIVVTAASAQAEDKAPIAVVKSTAKAVNSKDEQVEKLTALVDGKEVTLYTDDEKVLVKGTRSLEAGDVIQYRKNADGEITGIRVLFDINSKDKEFTSELSENLSIVYGSVSKIFGDSVNLSVNGGKVSNYKLPEGVKVYEADTNGSKTVVSNAEIADIEVFDSEDGNRLLLKIYKDEVTEAVIVR